MFCRNCPKVKYRIQIIGRQYIDAFRALTQIKEEYNCTIDGKPRGKKDKCNIPYMYMAVMAKPQTAAEKPVEQLRMRGI